MIGYFCVHAPSETSMPADTRDAGCTPPSPVNVRSQFLSVLHSISLPQKLFSSKLQTNDSLVAGFWQLYNQPCTKDEATLKRIANSVTNNRIRIEAYAALPPIRRRLYQHHR